MTKIPFSISFVDNLYEKIEHEYESGNYNAAIKTAILFLSESIKDRTDLELDGDKLITRAFSIEDPLIKVNALKTQTDRDEQIGFMLLFQGLYKAIRNPRSHNLVVDNKEECESILIFINYLLSVIEKAKPKIDFEEFMGLVNDPFFTKSDQYANEITKSLPKEKILDITLKTCENIDATNYHNIPYIVKSLILLLSKDEKLAFIKTCDLFLLKSTNVTQIKAYIEFLADDWTLIGVASRLRIINLLLKALNEFDFIYENTTNDFGNYETMVYMNENLLKFAATLSICLIRIRANYHSLQ